MRTAAGLVTEQGHLHPRQSAVSNDTGGCNYALTTGIVPLGGYPGKG